MPTSKKKSGCLSLFSRLSCLSVIAFVLLTLYVIIAPALSPASVVPDDCIAFAEISSAETIYSALNIAGNDAQPSLQKHKYASMNNGGYGALLPFLRLGAALYEDPDSSKPEMVIIISGRLIIRKLMKAGISIAAFSPQYERFKGKAPDGTSIPAFSLLNQGEFKDEKQNIYYIEKEGALLFSSSLTALWSFSSKSGADYEESSLNGLQEYQDLHTLLPEDGLLWAYVRTKLFYPMAENNPAIPETCAIVLLPSEPENLNVQLVAKADEANVRSVLNNIGESLKSMSSSGGDSGWVGIPFINMGVYYTVKNGIISVYDRENEPWSESLEGLYIKLKKPFLNTMLKALCMAGGIEQYAAMDRLNAASMSVTGKENKLKASLKLEFGE